VIFSGVLPQAFECGEHHRFHDKADMPWSFLLALHRRAKEKTKAAVPAALKSMRLLILRKKSHPLARFSGLGQASSRFAGEISVRYMH